MVLAIKPDPGFQELENSLHIIADRGLYRSRRMAENGQGIFLEVDGRKLLNFCSNDYLGLASHPEVIRAFQSAAERYGVGSGSAHLICGHSRPHHQLEEELAEFTGRDRALLFSTGYMANLGVISALIGKGDGVFEDRLNHASLLDGGLISGARFKRYRHTDVSSLKAGLKKAAVKRKLIVTDGVFSMDGDFAPLDQLAKVAGEFGGWLMVDDAHGMGVTGKNGRGTLSQFGLEQEDVPVLMGTLGKGFGTFGAFVAGSGELIETLIQKARTYIYTTALPPAVAEATRASLKLVIAEEWRREKLRTLVDQFRQGANQLGLGLMESHSAIQPVLIGESRKAVDASAFLVKEGLWVGAIRPPTVPEGSARLRITFSAEHRTEHVDRLLNALDQAGLRK